jgi:hypothetical protein
MVAMEMLEELKMLRWKESKSEMRSEGPQSFLQFIAP